ncbi:DNA-binding response regulator RstA [Alcanivorax sp. NBRC 101098]|nr:DNA-binding response regulator RstA [Alcanivorax sp. NBRC 101098]
MYNAYAYKHTIEIRLLQFAGLALEQNDNNDTNFKKDKDGMTTVQDNPPAIMIVEDDERLADLTCEYLQSNGLGVTVVSDGEEAIRRIRADQPDLVVLDLMLPGADGLTVCREVRSAYKNPILMLTARTDDMDQVLGLEMGADDYVAKPVKPRVLLARIRALLRRVETDSERDNSPARLEFGALVIDNSAREVTLAGDSVDLTSAEYDLLWLLASNAGTVLSRETIFEKLRGIQYDGQDRSIDVRISRIRPKVGDDPENPKRIKTVRSKGYLFVKEIGAI